MRRVAVLLLLAGSVARAEPADPACDTPCQIDKIRELIARGEITAARDGLVKLYELTQQPDLLFALGQVELQLEHYDAAIAYYEKFIASGPAEDQIALAQQAIGAARMQMAKPPLPPPVQPPPPKPLPPPTYERRWYAFDTVFVIAGGVAVLAGGGLLADSNHLGNDTSGTLHDYDRRLARARTFRIAGYSAVGAGAVLAAIAIVHWRMDRTEIEVAPGAVTVSRRW
jgi:tetratricopeptide (TPR) repeat protein